MTASCNCASGDVATARAVVAETAAPVAGKDAFQQLGRGRPPVKGRAGQRVVLGDVGEHDVDVVLGPAAGEHRVEELPVLVPGDDAVHDVGGGALGGVDSGGVAKLHVFGDVRRGEGDGVTVAPVSDDE